MKNVLESIWKEAIVAECKVLPDIYLKELRKATKRLKAAGSRDNI
jgi:hypothetical protein